MAIPPTEVTVEVGINHPTDRHSVNDELRLLPFKFEIIKCWDRGNSLWIVANVNDVSEGTPRYLTFEIPLPLLATGEDRARFIHAALLWAVTHEINECLRWSKDHKSVVNPHPEPFIGHSELYEMHVQAVRYDAEKQLQQGFELQRAKWATYCKAVKLLRTAGL